MVDTLSKKDGDVKELLCAISIIQPNWVTSGRGRVEEWLSVWKLIQKLQNDPSASDTFVWRIESLWYKDYLYICKNYQLKQNIILKLYTSLIGGSDSGFLNL